MYNKGKTLLIAQMNTEPPDKYIHKINIKVQIVKISNILTMPMS